MEHLRGWYSKMCSSKDVSQFYWCSQNISKPKWDFKLVQGAITTGEELEP